MWRKRKQQDFQAEIEAHLQLEADQLRAEGKPPAEALANARRAFGNRTIAEERFQEASGWLWLKHLIQDVRFGARLMRKNPVFAATIVLVLAFGTGANTAVFSVVNAVLIHAVPYEKPDELYRVFQQPQGGARMPVAPANFIDWRERSHSFRHMAAFQTELFKLERDGQREKFAGARVSSDFFATLAVNAAMGRVFLPEEDKPGAPKVAVLSQTLRTTVFAADPAILDRQIRLEGRNVRVIGVMPAGFAYPFEQSAIWTPLTLGDTDRSLSRTENYLWVLGRLKDGTGDQQAAAELDTIARQLSAAYPKSNARLGVAIRSLREDTVGNVRTGLLILLAAVAFVLLIAGANVSNLLLAKTAARRREIAVRVSLGASRRRVVRQLLAESMLLYLAGGAIGWLLAKVSFGLLLQLIPDSVPAASRIRLDSPVFFFTLAVSLVAGVLFGLAPALDVTRGKFTESLQGGRTSPGRRAARLRDLLVAGEVALALILLVGCGLTVRTMFKLYGVDLGFNPDRLITVPISLSMPAGQPGAPQPPEAGTTLAFRKLIARAAALPGVRQIGAISAVPLTNEYTGTRFMVEGRDIPETERIPTADYSVVTPAYFQTMEIPQRRGRAFGDSDGKNTRPVALINDAMAQRFFPGEDPVGRRLRRGGRDSDRPWITIVGVVGDVRHFGIDVAPVPELFFPHAQVPWPQLHLMVRTTAEPANLIEPVRRLVREMGANHDVGTPRTAEQLMASSVGMRQFAMQLLSLFAVLAFVLAGTGIYGVLSYSVAQRTQEVGIRMALGASVPEIVRVVIAHSAAPLAVGTLAGLGGCFALTSMMANLNYEVSPRDAVTFIAALVLLMLVAAAALFGPARRASRTDPLVALRCD